MKRSSKSISMMPRQVARLADAKGQMIHVVQGSLWITQENEKVDHVVPAGDSFAVCRNGATLLSALTPTTFQVLDRRDPAVSLESASAS